MMTVHEVSELAGVSKLDFNAFGTQEMEEYARQARESWQWNTAPGSWRKSVRPCAGRRQRRHFWRNAGS